MDDLREIIENVKGIKHTIVVMSGKGGVGKSTISANLAYALSTTGKRVGILDADFHGPTIPKLFGMENERMIVNDGRIKPPASEGIKVVSMALLLDEDKPVIWRGPLKMNALKQLLRDVEWGELDYLIIDLPPGTGDEPLSIAQLIPSDGTIVVSTPQEVALMSVRRSMTFARGVGLDVLGMVINMSYVACPNCGERIELFDHSEIEKTLNDFGTRILATLPFSLRVSSDSERGVPFLKDGLIEKSILEEFNKLVDEVISGE